MSRAIRVLLVDDHPLFRAGIRALLEAEGERFEVVGEASDGNEAVEKTRELEPDIVVMDLSMPEMGGLEATRRIDELEVDTRVLVLTMHAEEEYLIPVVEAGASGYLTKARADRELIEALEVVQRDEVHLPAEASRMLLERYLASARGGTPGLEDLSPREKEVLTLTAGGFSSREIGEKLDISPKTVDTYRSRLTGKLGLNHRSELFRFALEEGLLDES